MSNGWTDSIIDRSDLAGLRYSTRTARRTLMTASVRAADLKPVPRTPHADGIALRRELIEKIERALMQADVWLEELDGLGGGK